MSIVKNIELTDEQYRRLLTLINLAAPIASQDNEKINLDLRDIEQYISSHSSYFNSRDLVAYNEDTKFYHPSEILDEKVKSFLEHYNTTTLWFELADKLAVRDFEFFNKSEDIEKLSLQEFEEKLDELKLKYWKEFHANDIKNIKPLILNH